MAEEQLQRVLPYSLEAERAVLGSMIMDADAIIEASEILTKDDFYQKAHGMIFETLVEQYNQGKPTDVVTLQDSLKQKKDIAPQVYEVKFIRELMDSVPTSTRVKHYANIVAEKATFRRLIRLTENIANQCYEQSRPLEDLLEETEKSVFSLVQHRGQEDYTPIREIVLDVLNQINKASQLKSAVTGVATGFTDLDYKTAGFQPSDLILIAARPSMGKTAFALNIAQYVATRLHETVAIFSLEMSKEQLATRLLAMESHVNSQALRTGNMAEEDWQNLVDGAGVVAESNLIIDDTGSITVSELRSKCRKYKIENNLKLVLIDYLQLMSGSRQTDSRQQEVSDISRALKALARELSVPIVALSQLSRAVEKRDDKRPMLSDLRESGAIEQDADLVMFLYRDEYYHKDKEDNKNQAEVIIAKQRNGSIGTVNLIWQPEYTRFVNATLRDPGVS